MVCCVAKKIRNYKIKLIDGSSCWYSEDFIVD